MNLKLPNVTWDHVRDYFYNTCDCLGKLNSDNPLAAIFYSEEGLPEKWLDYGHPELQLPLWFSARVKPTFDNTHHSNGHKDWSYIVLNDDQILCLSPVFFEEFQLIELLTRDTGSFTASGPFIVRM